LLYQKFTPKSASENRLAFGKVRGKSRVTPFSGHGEDVYYLATRMVGALADRFRDRHNQQSAMISSCASIELQIY